MCNIDELKYDKLNILFKYTFFMWNVKTTSQWIDNKIGPRAFFPTKALTYRKHLIMFDILILVT